MAILRDVAVLAEQIGFTEIILPFIIVFTLIFATLQKTKVLGQYADGRPKKNYNAIVALVIGFSVLVMVRTLEVISLFTRYITLLLLAFVFVAIVATLLGIRNQNKNAIFSVALLLVIFALLQILAWVGVLPSDVVNRLLLPIIALAALGAAAWFMLIKTPEKEAPTHAPQRAERPAGRQPAGQPRSGRTVRAEDVPEGGHVEL